MGFLNMMGNSFGCSASGERLVSAARDGDVQEAKAILEYNPRLAKYSTFGLRNSPLHCSASQGHHEIVFLLLESGVNINLRNTRGQTALMQACQYGHWEVVQTLMLFKANIHRTDYLNGGTAIHFAAINGHSRCIRLVLAEYVPSIPDFLNIMRKKSKPKVPKVEFDERALFRVVNRQADGGITALHMAALNGHAETVELLLDLGACVSEVTIDDGSTIDLIGSGSNPLHYAACGGNAQCCQILISRGASLTAKNANGKYGWREADLSPAHDDPCVVCLERKCTVAAEGCGHEFCTRCALYLCSTSASSTSAGPPGAIACPLCRHAVVSFFKLPGASPIREFPRGSLSLSICATGKGPGSKPLSSSSAKTPLCRPELDCAHVPLRSSSFRFMSCQSFTSMKLTPSICMGTRSSIIGYSKSNLQRSVSQGDSRRSWIFALTSS